VLASPVGVVLLLWLPLSQSLAVEGAMTGAMVRVPGAVIDLGSTVDDMLAAASFCNRLTGRPTCQPEDFAIERRDQRARVVTFLMDRTEVSLGAYRRCERAGACTPHQMAPALLDVPRPERLPVTMVTLDQARAYCDFRGARLPTEEEFELAARGPTARAFAWGLHFHGARVNGGSPAPTYTNEGDGYDLLAPVDAFASGRTPLGILQLSGNAAEWTGSGEQDQAGTKTGRFLVRGGDFSSPPWQLRAAHRESVEPGERRPTLGFRCAESLSLAPEKL
jgi:formylglycine-generating enzyme required for sulfatase activity